VAFLKILGDRKLDKKAVCFIGNDINDLDCITASALSIAPADAHPSVRNLVSYITEAKGGNGVLREVADLILGNGD
jgi:YrbI family 3-deoxy-D-manno-octulosonate 8-phosphate phosphatase